MAGHVIYSGKSGGSGMAELGLKGLSQYLDLSSRASFLIFLNLIEFLAKSRIIVASRLVRINVLNNAALTQ